MENLPAAERTDEEILGLLTESINYGLPLGVISDYVVFPDGEMLCGDGWVPDEGYDPTRNDYYQEPAASGERYISTPYVDATTGWTLGLSFPQAVTHRRMAIQLGIRAAIFIIALLVSSFILTVFLRRKLRPLQSVVSAAQEIERGNLDVNYQISSGDEIGQLAATFQSTTRYLREVIGEISSILTRIAAGILTPAAGFGLRPVSQMAREAD